MERYRGRFASLRTIISNASALPRATKAGIVVYWGAGLPLALNEVRPLDEQGWEVGPGEEQLVAHASVAEAAVFGVPDAHWDKALVSFIVSRPGGPLDPSALEAFCRECLAGYKVLKNELRKSLQAAG